jgi:hypothetical protein
MSVSVASNRLQRLDDLSPAGQLILGLIADGESWLKWALHHPTARYHFEDERALVAAVQAGIHGSDLISIPALGLLVSPVKLASMGEADLDTLAAAQATYDADAATRTRVRRILAKYALVTARDLLAVPAFLDGLGVGDSAIFQAMDLDARIAVLGLVNMSSEEEGLPAAFRGEAAAFAVEYAQSPQEFADYYHVYLDLVGRVGSLTQTPPHRAALVKSAVRQLRPLLLQALDAPRLERRGRERDVAAAIAEWLMLGRRLGFARLSQGVRQIVAQPEFAGERGEAAAEIVEGQLNGAQAVLASGDLRLVHVGQDGSTFVFESRSCAGEVWVELGAERILTLRGFRRSLRPDADKGPHGHGHGQGHGQGSRPPLPPRRVREPAVRKRGGAA